VRLVQIVAAAATVAVAPAAAVAVAAVAAPAATVAVAPAAALAVAPAPVVAAVAAPAATVAVAPAAALTVALAPVVAAAVAPTAVAVAAPAAPAFAPIPAGPDLLRDLCRDCDIELLVFKLHLEWGYDGDVLAYRVRVQVPRVRGSRVPAGSALPFTITAAFAIGAQDRR